MSYNCEIENKLHQARLQTLNNHFEEAMQLFIEALDSLENHKKECAEEELEWTNACFNRTLEEFNLIRDAHPDIQIRVQDSDSEESIATENVATESVADDTQVNNQDNGFLQSMENVSSEVINKLKQFDEDYHISDSVSNAFATGKKNVENFFAEKPLGERIKDGYNDTINYCKENHVVEKGVNIVKIAACVIIKGVIVVSKAVAKGVRVVINNYNTTHTDNRVSEAADQYSHKDGSFEEKRNEYVVPQPDPVYVESSKKASE